ncbi:hypothetical protein A2U01_0070025, partial [Trifolium medium]|nr:hypothetical protein [Trifolium medium]
MLAAHMWNEWAVVRGIIGEQQGLEQQLLTVRTAVQWQQPRFGHVKCNIDASFYDTAGAT